MASSAALLFAMASCGNPAADGKKLAEKNCDCMLKTSMEEYEDCLHEMDEMKDDCREKYSGKDAQALSKAYGENPAELMNAKSEGINAGRNCHGTTELVY